MTEDASAGRLVAEVVADTTGFRAALQRRLDAETRNMRVRIQAEVAGRVEFDRAQIRRELATKLAQAANGVRAVRVQVEVHADTSRLDRQLAETRARWQRQPLNIPLRFDTPMLAQVSRHIGNALASMSKIPAIASGLLVAAGAATNLAGGLFAMTASASQAVGILAVIPGVAAAAVQGIGTLVLGFAGIGDAVKAMGQAQKQTGQAAGQSAQRQVAAAEQVRSAQERLAEAHRAGAERVASAERALSDAQRAQGEAQEALTRARERAREELQQLAFSLRDAVLSEEQAEISLARAQERVLKARQSAVMSPIDKRQAELDYRQAILDLDEAKDRASDLAKENRKAQREGVEGSEAVRDARRQVADSGRAVRDAERGVADAHREAAQQVRDAQRAVAAAMRATAQQATASSASSVALANAMDNLSPAGQRFARFVQGTLLPRFKQMRFAVQESLLPRMEQGITAALPLLDVLQGQFARTGATVGDLAIRFGQLAGSPAFRADTATIMQSNDRAVRSFGNAGIYLADVLRHVMVAAGPLVERFADLIERWSKGAAEAAKTGRETGRMAAFFDRVWKSGGQLRDILRDVGAAFFNLGKLSRPTGDTLLDSLAASAERFRKATEDPANQERIRAFFENTVPVMTQFGDLLNRVVMLFVRLGEATGGGTLDGLFMVLNAAVRLLEMVASMPGGGTALSTIFLLAGAGMGLGLVAKALGSMVRSLSILARLSGATRLFQALTRLPEGAQGGFMARARAAGGRIRSAPGRAAGAVRSGLGRAGGAVASGAQAAGRFLLSGARAAGTALITAGRATGAAIGRAARAAGSGAAAAGRGIGRGAAAVGSAAASGAQAAGRALAAAGKAAASAARSAAAFAGSVARAGATAVITGMRAVGSAVGSAAAAARRGVVAFGALAVAQARAAAAAVAQAAKTVILTAAQRVAALATRGWAIAQALLNLAWVASPIGLIVAGVALLAAGFVLAYKKIGWFRTAVDAVFRFLKSAVVVTIGFVRNHWRLIIAIVLGPLGLLIGLVTKYWSQIYGALRRAVVGTINWVRSHWRLIISIIGGPLGLLIALVTKHWSRIRAVFTNALTAVLNKARSVMSAMHNAFNSGMTAIAKAWARLQDASKKPVNFMIQTVYNRGIRGLWNKVMGWLHIKGMDLNEIKPLKRGGTITDPAPARPMVTNRPLAIVGEGRPAHPEFVIPTDPRYRARAQALWAAAGSKLQMLKKGGIVGGVLSGIKKAAGKALEIGKAGLDLITNPGKIWDKLAGPVLRMATGIGEGPWATAIKAIPPKLMDPVRGAAMQVIKAFNDGFGGDSMGVLNAARSMLGKGDDGGDNVNWLTRAWGMVGAPWCAMFASEAIKIAKATKKYPGYPTAAVAGYADRMRHGPVSGGKPGWLAVYRGTGPGGWGHVNVIEKNTGGGGYNTIGGNEGPRVKRSSGRRPDAVLRPLARGGLLDVYAQRNFDRADRTNPLIETVVGALQRGVPDMAARGIAAVLSSTGVYRRDSGGPLPPGGWAYNGLGRTEWVLTPEAVDVLGGGPAVARLNANAARLRRAARSTPRATPRPAEAAGEAGSPTVNVYPQPRQSEEEIGTVAARKLGAML